MGDVNRRDALITATGACLAVSWRGTFGQASRPHRLAYLSPESDSTGKATFDAFREGLRALGYVEGRSLVLDARFGDGSDEKLDRYAADLLKSGPDLLVAQTRAVFAVKRAGATLPVVFGFSGDPVLAKLAESLSRPGGNYTGLSMMSLELTAKRMELLKEILPALKRVAVIANPGHAGEQAELRVSQQSAKALGIALEYFPVRGFADLDAALAGIRQAHCEGIVVFPDAGTMSYSERIAQFTLETRIPAMSGWAMFAERGNLVTYGPELRDAFRRLANYVDRILKGARPADLPIELPTKFELAINLKTAKALGLTVPPSVRLRADRFIE